MATPKIIADFETQLATAIAVGGTSFTLSSATDDDGVALPNGTYYFTVDNGSSAKEYLMGTVAGTAVTSVYNVSRQGVETSGALRAHRVGASVIITDFATYKKYMDGIALVSAPDADTATKGVSEMATQAETDAGTTTGSTSANLFVNPSTLRGRAINDYAADAGGTDAYAIAPTPAITAYATGQIFTFKANTANTGACTLAVSGLAAKAIKKNVNVDLDTGDILANQILTVVYDGTNFQYLNIADRNTKSVLAGETITGATLPVPVYQNKTDNEFYMCDGNDTGKLKFVGFAVSDGTNGNALSVQFVGIVAGFSGLDEGEKYYLSDTVGAISNAPGTYEVLVGVAISSTELLIQKGSRYASGVVTISATGDTTVTTGFRASKITIDAFANSNDDASFISHGGWTIFGSNDCVKLCASADAGDSGASSSTSFAFSTSAADGNITYAEGTISSVTDTTFVINTATYNSANSFLFWTAVGEQ